MQYPNASTRFDSINYFSSFRDPNIGNIVQTYDIPVQNNQIEIINQIKFLVRSLGYFCQLFNKKNYLVSILKTINSKLIYNKYYLKRSDQS